MCSPVYQSAPEEEEEEEEEKRTPTTCEEDAPEKSENPTEAEKQEDPAPTELEKKDDPAPPTESQKQDDPTPTEVKRSARISIVFLRKLVNVWFLGFVKKSVVFGTTGGFMLWGRSILAIMADYSYTFCSKGTKKIKLTLCLLLGR